MRKKGSGGKRKLTRRIRVGVVAFESYGIERGDRAIVAMTGDVRIGELGYFETGSYWGGNGCPRELHTHSWFAFLCAQDGVCEKWHNKRIEGGICLRSRVDVCHGEHGAEATDETAIYNPVYDPDEERNFLTNTFGRVVAVERDGQEIQCDLTFRALDDREQPTTFIEPYAPPAVRAVREVVSEPNLLPPVEKRQGPLTAEQHEKIARLIKSSMDSTAKNPQPELTHQARIVVRREVTRLAGIVGQRRLRNHSATFSRSLAKFENGEWCKADERAGRLAIEHLWRWLHGYTAPVESEETKERILRQANEKLAAYHARKAGGDGPESVGGLLMIEVPCDVPAENLKAGQMVMVKQGDPIPNGAFGLVRVERGLALGRIFQLDPDHIRLGMDTRMDGENVYHMSEVEIVGPVISGDCTFERLDKAEEDAVLAMYNSVAALLAAPDKEWPDVIDG